MNVTRFTLIAAAMALALGAPLTARAELAQYYIGIDSRDTPYDAPASEGGGAYPDNPNENRLTLLLQHGSHYHGIGQYTYSGSAASPTLVDTNSNNRLPEGYTGQEPLPLLPGSGVYAGKMTSKALFGVTYSDLEMLNVQSLDGAGALEQVLFDSSSGRWNAEFDTAHIHLELVSVSSPLLGVGTLGNPNALSFGGDVHLGDGDELFSFTPVLWVDEAAPVGTYSAEFRLVDESSAFGDSGRFFIDVQQVPEPTALSLAGVVMIALGVTRRRNA
ncbi:hypothetical protein Mal64_24370 [Pseudobythopirellula maris]|uniref:PEP-CTERM protein-sorting domain-containing protein n=1 Tax=Pseudobythopirellula maris TaxID=2527991 RepID=A0A5C5ZPV7_9BACT|nr:all3515 family Zur-repressed PEP-CTERM protein [Pseudobythopirellula maris]TWT88947.1 hypothetical protein Mal64_24370 [Pseudobythopirellula maris]